MKSAEEQVAQLLRALAASTQFEVSKLRKDVALFALIVWVAAARKLLREQRRGALGVSAAMSMVQALLLGKFRSYEKRLAAQIEGIVLAQKLDFSKGMSKITGDVKFGKTRRFSADSLSVMGFTLNETFRMQLQAFQQRLVLRLRTDSLLPADTAISSVLGARLADAEDLYDTLGGSYPDDDFSGRARLAEQALSIIPSTGPVAKLASGLIQTADDFAFTGLIDSTSALMSHSDAVSAIAAIVTEDDRTGEFCTKLVGGIWDVGTRKALPESRVSVDFPGFSPYHPNCRTLNVPVFHAGLVFKSGVKASGKAPELPAKRG